VGLYRLHKIYKSDSRKLTSAMHPLPKQNGRKGSVNDQNEKQCATPSTFVRSKKKRLKRIEITYRNVVQGRGTESLADDVRT